MTNSTTNPTLLSPEATLGVSVFKNGAMSALYLVYIVAFVVLFIAKRQPVRIRLFVPVLCVLAPFLSFLYLIARDSIEYAHPPESRGREVGYLVIDIFWMIVLGPLYTLSTLMFSLTHIRYVLVVNWFRQKQQQIFHKDALSDGVSSLLTPGPGAGSHDIELQTGTAAPATLGTTPIVPPVTPIIPSETNEDKNQERVIRWLRTVSSTKMFVLIYVIVQSIVSTAYIILLILDHGLKLIPYRMSYKIGVYVQNVSGYVILMGTLFLSSIEFLVHMVRRCRAKSEEKRSIRQHISEFFLDQPYYFHLDTLVLLPMLIVATVSIADRFMRAIPRPFYELVDVLFQTFWLFSVGSGFTVIIALVNWRREHVVKQRMKQDQEAKNNVNETATELLLKALEDANRRRSFEAYCRKEYSAENLWCLFTIQKYEKLPMGPERLGFYCDQLHAKFIQPSSVYEVNIDAEVRTKLVHPDKIRSEQASMDEIDHGVSLLKKSMIENLKDTYMRYEIHYRSGARRRHHFRTSSV